MWQAHGDQKIVSQVTVASNKHINNLNKLLVFAFCRCKDCSYQYYLIDSTPTYHLPPTTSIQQPSWPKHPSTPSLTLWHPGNHLFCFGSITAARASVWDTPFYLWTRVIACGDICIQNEYMCWRVSICIQQWDTHLWWCESGVCVSCLMGVCIWWWVSVCVCIWGWVYVYMFDSECESICVYIQQWVCIKRWVSTKLTSWMSPGPLKHQQVHPYSDVPPMHREWELLQVRLAVFTSGNWLGFGIHRHIWSIINTPQSVDKILFGLNTLK
jgi:hypothetical protein